MSHKLGFGCMRLPLLDPDDHKSVDKEQVNRMFDLYLERGFTYFDTAWMYHDHESEKIVGECLVARHPRDSFAVTSKMPVGMLDSADDMQRVFDEQLRKTGLDRFDNYLLHNINERSYAKAREFGTFEFVAAQRDAGKIGRMGFSFHDSPEMLDEVLTAHPEVELVQLQINYLDWNDRGIRARECYEVAMRHGKHILIMEPVKGGALARLPERAAQVLAEADPDVTQAEWAIRFAAGLPGVEMVLSGMSDLAQVEQNTQTMLDLEPLSDDERNLLERVARIVREDVAVPCTACRYCVEGCPKQIPIPTYFALYNEYMRAPSCPTPKAYYANYAARGSAAGDCIGCRKCVASCPQHIMIPEMLADVSKAFDAPKQG